VAINRKAPFESASENQIAFVVIGNPAALIVSCSAVATSVEQEARWGITGDEDVPIEWVGELSTAQVDVVGRRAAKSQWLNPVRANQHSR